MSPFPIYCSVLFCSGTFWKSKHLSKLMVFADYILILDESHVSYDQIASSSDHSGTAASPFSASLATQIWWAAPRAQSSSVSLYSCS